jgi:hypothetical protein
MTREDENAGERSRDTIRKPFSALAVLKIKQTSPSGERENHDSQKGQNEERNHNGPIPS